MENINRILEKQKKAGALIEAARVSDFLRQKYGLPMNYGVVSTQLVTNGYGDFRELRIKFDGELVDRITALDDLPVFMMPKQ